jgi:predicted RNase H-like HicB family nuclease
MPENHHHGLITGRKRRAEDPLLWQGCGKFERRAWQRARYQQTEIAHANAAHGEARASSRDVADTTLPIRRPPSTMKVMKSERSKTFSYSVFYEQAPEGGYVAFVPALPGCHTQGETLEETERNVKEAIAVYLESLAAHGDAIPVEGPSFQGRVTVPA